MGASIPASSSSAASKRLCPRLALLIPREHLDSPSYSPHVPSGPPQAPQHAQNHIQGRQTPVSVVPQPRFPTPSTSAPSPPVLLPPQTNQIPPSLQSLPVNATPDGTGQHGSHQRPPSTPVVASPTPNIPRNAYPQHQTTILPTSTPIRPPSGLAATHPTSAVAKPPVQTIQPPQLPTSVRHAQPQAHARPKPHSQQPPVPTTPSQPQHAKGIPRSYGAQYNQHSKSAGGSDVAQRPQPPIHTPVSTPRPPSISQVQTPSGVGSAPYVIRGHGTKWISTPTPSTPRISGSEGYFDIESPAYEPLSPPARPAELPGVPLSTEKDSNKPIMKTDLAKSRSRPPRVTHKAETVSEPTEVPLEPDLPVPPIKNEEATPQTLQEAIDTAAKETPPGRTPATVNTLPSKRKRQDSPPHSWTTSPGNPRTLDPCFS
ncbi:hypothetical protein NUW58_g5867 [Xylaria curta]|uniref:Uncharacterized protein n=1 Tax=Xylaria curta TaxID=42375 RepID=A0ACC1P0T7_9PEZI|nr:hypothetical protein NUW58_g5867 [Xylaria curta]